MRKLQNKPKPEVKKEVKKEEAKKEEAKKSEAEAKGEAKKAEKMEDVPTSTTPPNPSSNGK